MIKKHVQLRIHDLLDAGLPVREIVEMTGVSIATIYKYKRLGRQLQGGTPKAEREKLMAELNPYKELIDSYIKRKKIHIKTLVFAVHQAGYTGRNDIIEQYYRERRQELQPERVMQHTETKMGEQAQVDWGHFGEIMINGKVEKLYLFAYILSYSRTIYLEFVVRQNQKTLQHCHIRAFEALGIPKVIVYDNMKTVVSHRERIPGGEDKVYFNPEFTDFAQYYSFRLFACPPYWPRTKGKVEATIKYVRKYFPRISPKQSITLAELNERLATWVSETAHERVHGSTHEKPSVRWAEEKQYLRFPTNIPPYDAAPLQTSYTTQYGLLVKNGVTYNLGPSYARLKLEVREIHNHGLPLLEMYRQNKLVLTIPVPAKKHTWVSADQAPQLETPKPKIERRPHHAAYDIKVEQRDLNYYQIPGL